MEELFFFAIIVGFDNFHSHEMEELFFFTIIVDVKFCQTFSNQHFGQGE